MALKINPLPGLSVLHSLLDYNPNTGQFTWLRDRGFKAKAGSPAGTRSSSGYLIISINMTRYQAHRIAYKMVHGVEPEALIDHIDGDKTNNRISNLRVAGGSQNQGNSRKPSHNSSGYKGVSWREADQRWVAQIGRNGKRIWIGSFKTKEEAAKAYAAAASKHFGEFMNSGEGLDNE